MPSGTQAVKAAGNHHASRMLLRNIDDASAEEPACRMRMAQSWRGIALTSPHGVQGIRQILLLN